MDNISLLLVEDNPADAGLILEYLAERPCGKLKTKVVSSLAEAMIALAKESFDVVLLDLSLPDSVGLDTVRALINCFPALAIIVLTGVHDERLAIQSVRYGAQDYLEKNMVSPVLLGRSILYAIERKRHLKQKENLLADLSGAMEEIEMLHSVLPICAGCKKVRDDQGEWLSIKEFLLKKTGNKLRHHACPNCLNDLYPEGNLSCSGVH